MQRNINPVLLVGIIGVCVLGPLFAAQFGRAVWGNRDIWWTPKTLALSLDETQADFQVFVSDAPLQDLVAQGALTTTDSSGKRHQVVAQEISVRLNNWHKVKATFLYSAIFSAFMLGLAVTCLMLGLVQVFAERKKACQPEDAGKSKL